MLDTLHEILLRCCSENLEKMSNTQPTLLYNEGWMIRLLTAASIEHGIDLEWINFSREPEPYWFSEALIEPPFLSKRMKRGHGEGYTHADMVIGDFIVPVIQTGSRDADEEIQKTLLARVATDVEQPDQKLKRSLKKGKAYITKGATMFGVIEAKMNSSFSAGIANAEEYCQTSRNLACVAYMAYRAGIWGDDARLFFGAVAPECKKEHMREKIEKTFMLEEIQERIRWFKENEDFEKWGDRFSRNLDTCETFLISYEEWIKRFEGVDSTTYEALEEFRERCYWYNGVKKAP